MDFRQYLEEHRDPKHLPKLLEQIKDGVESLLQLGYLHRDLEPYNILITLRHLTATIIDSISPNEVCSHKWYSPRNPWLLTSKIDGSSDTRPEEYDGVAQDRAAQQKGEEYCKDKETSTQLRVLLSKTMHRAEVGSPIHQEEGAQHPVPQASYHKSRAGMSRAQKALLQALLLMITCARGERDAVRSAAARLSERAF